MLVVSSDLLLLLLNIARHGCVFPKDLIKLQRGLVSKSSQYIVVGKDLYHKFGARTREI